jgi:uncharacterized repeat protein (TIGR01451 family)
MAHVVLPQSAQMTLSETASTSSNTPAAGDTLNYTFSLTNTGNVTLHDQTVTDTVATGITLEQNGSNIVGDANHNGQFDVGETWKFDGTYTLTAADILSGVSDTATAAALGPQDQIVSATSSFTFHS